MVYTACHRFFGRFEAYCLPRAAVIILLYEFLERFAFFGLRGILTIYLKDYLKFSSKVASLLYHLFVALNTVTPLFGAFISDNYLGKYWSICVIGALCLLCHGLVALVSITRNVVGSLIVIYVLGITVGGLKPCVAAFGGDQVTHINQLDLYFSLFYASINFGASFSQVLSPVLRDSIPCSGSTQCYPLSFGVTAAVFLMAYVIFLLCRSWYIKSPSAGNVLEKFIGCIHYAVKQWWIGRKSAIHKPSLIDYADDRYTKSFIEDVKKALAVLALFLPFPLFWAAFEQMGSKWTLQAQSMDGRIGEHFSIKADQMQSLNPIYIIIMIPIFQSVIYPIFSKYKILMSPTSRITAGYFLAALAFIYTGLLQISIDQTIDKSLPVTLTHFSIINTHKCDVRVELRGMNTTNTTEYFLPPLFSGENTTHDLKTLHFSLNSSEIDYLRFVNASQCDDGPFDSQISLQRINVSGKMKSLALFYDHEIATMRVNYSDVCSTLSGPQNTIKLLILNRKRLKRVSLVKSHVTHEFILSDKVLQNGLFTPCKQIDPGEYEIQFNWNTNFTLSNNFQKRIKLQPFQSDVLVLNEDQPEEMILLNEVSFNLRHMFWQVIQYFLITCAEILFSVTAMTFAYSEAPISMKALLQSFYLLTIFGGNIIIAIVTALSGQHAGAVEFFVFAFLVTLAGIVNWKLWRRYERQKLEYAKYQLYLQQELTASQQTLPSLMC